LTRRPNQGHIDIIAKSVRPASGNRQRAFFLRDDCSRMFQFVESVSAHFLKFLDGAKMV
jgi:hypothetical protein